MGLCHVFIFLIGLDFGGFDSLTYGQRGQVFLLVVSAGTIDFFEQPNPRRFTNTSSSQSLVFSSTAYLLLFN